VAELFGHTWVDVLAFSSHFGACFFNHSSNSGGFPLLSVEECRHMNLFLQAASFVRSSSTV